MKRTKAARDTDYLALSARVRVLEGRLLTWEGAQRLLEAKEEGEAARILSQCGYPAAALPRREGVEAMLAQAQQNLWADFAQALGEGDHILPLLRIPIDYHNAKALVKGEGAKGSVSHLLERGGRYHPGELEDAFGRGELPEGVSDPFRAAVQGARTLLAETRDPQRSDFLLDRACLQEQLQEAEGSGCGFLKEYVQLLIDSADLRAYVRAARSGMPRLEEALIPGGRVAPEAVLGARDPQEMARLYRDTPLREAALAGAAVLEGKETLAHFEGLCQRAVSAFIAQGARVPFGPEPVAAYLLARQREGTILRVILEGKLAGVDRETLRERLGEWYG